MICPNCGAEYVEGISECSDCLVELIPTENFISNDEEVSLEDWKEIFSTNDMIEAEMIKANLKGAAIDAIIFSKEDRMRINLSFVGAAPIKLFVKDFNEEAAKQIIDDIINTKPEDEE